MSDVSVNAVRNDLAVAARRIRSAATEAEHWADQGLADDLYGVSEYLRGAIATLDQSPRRKQAFQHVRAYLYNSA